MNTHYAPDCNTAVIGLPSPMSIGDAQLAKAAAATQIAEILATFSRNTGLVVTSLDVTMISQLGTTSQYLVDIEAKL